MATRRTNGEGIIQYNNESQLGSSFFKKDPAIKVIYCQKFSCKT